MNTQTQAIPGAAVRGVASGVFFMAFFSTLWAGIGIGGLQGWGEVWLLVVVILIGVMLLIGGVSLLIAARRMPDQVAGEDARQGRRIGIWFGVVFTTEGLLIGVASVICNAINRFDLFFPIMAIIVGVHFFPLAPLFEVKAYYLVGALLCLLAIIALLLLPENASIGSQHITVSWVVLGFGVALILWSVGLGLWLLGKRLLAQSESARI